jgi:hypothetical protein
MIPKMRALPGQLRGGRPALRPLVLCAALFGALLFAGQGVARAQRQDAARYLAQGIARFSDGAFSASRTLLLQALHQTQEARLLGQIHLYLGLNDISENKRSGATVHFRKALLHDPHLDLDPDHFKPAFVELFRSVRRSLLGALQVTMRGRSGEVWIDNEWRGTTPLRAAMAPGYYRVEIRSRAGRVLFQNRVEIVSGQSVRLVADSGALAKEPATSQPAGEKAPTIPPPPPPPPPARRLWTWIAAGGAVASMVVAIGVGVSAKRDYDAACDLLADDSLSCEQRQRLIDSSSREEFNRLHDAVNRKALATNLAWAAAGVLTVGAVILYWLEGRNPPRRDDPPKPSVVSWGQRGLSLRWSY